ncbi:hypothetical protein [Arcticibacterium luteifluviistationis]|uniref:Histidine kinase n=1 Tax=Arcticibacterium luteifluviistationis TaxID=1784714 RepID=A0A2Z4GD05_9BACT|nr:hypothetical protein [Arcticibacterium luteifluviistationis]AWV99031.1 hypothetical protein DJ013_12990 [Arcticibacterium luteifluviistationis]
MISSYHISVSYKLIVKLTTIFLLSLYQRNAFTQHYPTLQYTTKDGLGQLQILSTLEDSRGYIWVGHKGGLSKFDGQNFENFNHTQGMTRNFVNDLVQ